MWPAELGVLHSLLRRPMPLSAEEIRSLGMPVQPLLFAHLVPVVVAC